MKTLRFFFVLLFLVGLITPLLKFDFYSVNSETENRVLATFPGFIKEKKINTNVFKELDQYTLDRFGFKNQLVHWDNYMKYNCFFDAGNNQAILGKNGWLYYINARDGDNFSDFMKTNLWSEQELKLLVQKIKSRSDWCKKNGIQFMLMIVPNKHSVYPEYYPIKRPQGITRGDQMEFALEKEKGINSFFVKKLLLSKKSKNRLLYYPTDTHWNQHGIYYVYLEFIERMKKMFPEQKFEKLRFKVKSELDRKKRNLFLVLGLLNKQSTIHPSYTPLCGNWNKYFKISTEDNKQLITFSKNRKKREALIFRDSFFVEFYPFVSTLFSKVSYCQEAFDDNQKDNILKNKPDVVIWEMVERYAPRILDTDWEGSK